MFQPDPNAFAYKTPLPGIPGLSPMMGPILDFVATPQEAAGQFSAATGPMLPGTFIPLHAHPEAELIFVLHGRFQALSFSAGTPRWIELQTGESVLIPSGARHALRNSSDQPCTLLLVSAASMGEFFQEVGRPVTPGDAPPLPNSEWMKSFMDAAMRRSYWMGSPAENREVGIDLTF